MEFPVLFLRRAVDVVSVRSQANLHFDKENVEQRQQTINSSYKKLCTLGQVGWQN